MTTRADPERRFAIFAALSLPWLMLWLTDWTVTPVGMVDAWIYRALGRDLLHANTTLSEYYYAARPFVLVPRYLLTRVFLEGAAHTVYGVLCAHVLLFAVLDFLTSVARPGTRLFGVLIFGTCMYLLRSLGWGYIDGSILTWFLVALAGVARWYRAGSSDLSRRAGALLAGGCFAAMLSTHPMTLPMLVTPLCLIVWQQRATKQARGWLLWLELTVGGVGAVILMGAVCELLYGRFFYFMPIIDAALSISSAAWDRAVDQWVGEANWLVILAFATAVAAWQWAAAKIRRVELTGFESFAWLNLLILMALMLALDLFTSGYWLQYAWFASYFLPAALLALAALLGERVEVALTTRSMIAVTLVFVVGVSLAYRLELSFILPAFDARYFPFREPALWLGRFSLLALQLGVATLSLLGLIAWRSVGGAQRWVLVPSLWVALVLGGPINRIGSGDATEVQVSESVAQAIVIIQDELRGRRPVYWYDAEHPLARFFVTLSSAHLGFFSELREEYPRGARALRGRGPASEVFFESGDPVVILDETTERFPRAQKSFAEIGITLTEWRRVPLRVADRTWWLIFATLEPGVLTLEASGLPTTLKAASLSGGGRVSEREQGFLAFGPYVLLVPGKHRITFHLRLLDAPGGERLGLVEAGAFTAVPNRVLGRKELLASDAFPNGDLDVTLEFDLNEPVPSVEFRAFAHGTARLLLRSIEVQRPTPGALHSR